MKYYKYIVLLAAASFIYSCDTDSFLNPLPESAVVLETFFKTDADVLAGIIGIYDAAQGVNENTESNISNFNRGIQFEYMLTEMRSDNTRTKTLEGSKADFHRYIVDANNVQSEDFYASMYDIIYRANNVLNYIEVADEGNQARYTGEAKFLRAFAYFKLVRLFGDVPLVTSVVTADQEELLFTRVSVSEIYNQITSDLQDAIGSLDNKFRSRASKGAAQGLLAKVYLSQPSPNYSGAQTLCDSVISSMNYSLQDNFADIFYNELNDEIIFAIQYNAANPQESQGFSAEFTAFKRQGRDDGHNMVNDNLRIDFELYGGNRTENSYIGLGSFYEVIKFLPEGSDISIPEYGNTARDAGNDWIVLRYADVLLMRSEAILAGAAETTSSIAIDSYMEVRERAGFEASERPTSLTADALLVERRVELAFENHRFYDLQRFGMADAILSAHAVELGYPGYNTRKLLLPIPAREINLSKGLLTQNPGY